MKRFAMIALSMCVVGLVAFTYAAPADPADPGPPALPAGPHPAHPRPAGPHPAQPQPAKSEALPGNAKPLVSGEFLSGTLWEKPVIHTPGSNTGYSPAAGSRVDVYETFIVVTDAEGIAELSLHGSYTKLRFKPYRP